MDQEKYIKQIDRYLSNQMPDEERKAFEHEVNNNPDLSNLLGEFKQTLSVLNRNWIERSWEKAAFKMLFVKTAITVLIAASVLAVGMITFKQIKKHKTVHSRVEANKLEPQPKHQDSLLSSAQLDTIPTEKPAPKAPQTKTSFICKADLLRKQKLEEEKLLAKTQKTYLPDLEKQKLLTELEQFKRLERLQHDPLTNAQTFYLLSSKDTVITGKKGIKVAIPARSFVDSLGQQVHGEIEIKLTEYTSAYDLFEQGIGTNSNEGLLASGGSCYLMAYQNGKELKMKLEGLIAIEFPSKKDPNMTYFEGKTTDTGVLWTSTPALPKYVSVSNLTHTDNPTFKVIRNVDEGIFSDIPIDDRTQMFCFNLKATKEGQKNPLIQKMIEDSIHYKSAYTYFNGLKLGNRNWAYDLFQKQEKTLEMDTLNIHYQINENGTLYKYSTSGTKRRKDKRKLKKLAKYQGQLLIDSNWTLGEYNFTLKLIPGVNYSSQTKNRFKTDSMLKDEYELKQLLNNKIYANRLGYINCDKFTQRARAKTAVFRSNYTTGSLYIHIPRINGLLRQSANSSVKLLPQEKVNIVYVTYGGTGLKMSILENYKVKSVNWVDANLVPFDKTKIKKALN